MLELPLLELDLGRGRLGPPVVAGPPDKDAHAIRKVTLDGVIVTVAGTNQAGDDGDTPGPGTERRLSSPNGLWVRDDGTLYILDLGNSKIRRLGTDGVLTTLVSDSDGIVRATPLRRGAFCLGSFVCAGPR